MDSDNLPEEFHATEFKASLKKLLVVLNYFSKTCAANDLSDYGVTSQHEKLRATFKDDETYKLLTEINDEINVHMAKYEVLCESGEIRLILNYLVSASKNLKTSINHLHHLMTTMENLDPYHVTHYCFCIKTTSEELAEKVKEFEPLDA